jgi:hypothetical protein
VIAGVMTPDANIAVTRIQAVAQTGPAGCTTQPVLFATDGTSPGTIPLALSGLLNDSGPIAVNYAAGATIYLLAVPPVACTTRPADVNVLVQYKGN